MKKDSHDVKTKACMTPAGFQDAKLIKKVLVDAMLRTLNWCCITESVSVHFRTKTLDAG